MALPTLDEIQRVIERWRASPRLFVVEALGVSDTITEVDGFREGMEPWQRDALDTIAKNDRLSIKAGHGVGKTAFEAWIVWWFLVTRYPCKIPITANSQDQLRDVVWAEIALWGRRLPEEFRSQFEVTAERIFLKSAPEECFAVARTASKERPEALQGFHATHLLFVIEEASGIDDIIFEVAQGALSTPGAKVVMCANPTRLSGYFFDTHHTLRHRWATMTVNSEDVPRARGHIEDIIAKYGKDSNAYRIRVQGEFPTTEDEQVIPLEWIKAAVGRNVAKVARYQPVWGVDVARFGDDRTALAKRQNNHLLEPIKSWRGKDSMQVAGIIKHEYDSTIPPMRPYEILVDVIGVGAGVVDRLYELGLPVRGINVGEQASSKEQFVRLRDELWWAGRKFFEAKDCQIPNDDALISELCAPTYKFMSTGKIIIESKDEMKKRISRSPDLADAFLLTLAAGQGVPFEEKKSDYNEDYTKQARSWMSA
jgi:phage terminase large subunit